MANIKTKLARIKKKALKTAYRSYDFIMDTDLNIRYTQFTNGYHNPNYSFEKHQIALIHIPKTGGTSLLKLLSKDTNKLFVNTTAIHRPIALGHSPQEYQYITVMRNPIARVWSQYQMVLREGEKYAYYRFASRGLDVFLKKCWAVQNMNCRYLSGEEQAAPNQATYQKALMNLSSFYKVFDFENFAEEVEQFLIQHDVPYEQIPNERKASYQSPTAEERALIAQYNQLDIALYEAFKAQIG